MSREDIEKLLGGYATATLSDAERRALFEAALEDQELFDALAKEHTLRDVLQDPAARAQLLEALGPARQRFRVRVWRWLQRPAGLALAGGFACMVVLIGVAVRQGHRPEREEILTAAVTQPGPPVKIFEPAPSEKKLQRAAPLPAPPVVLEQAEMAKEYLTGRARDVLPAPPVVPAQAPAPLPSAEERTLTRLAAAASVKSRAKVQQASAISFEPRGTALRYELLLRDPAGQYVPVAADFTLHVGTSVRLRLEPNEDGTIYLFQGDPAGGWNLIASRQVEKGQICDLPSDNGLEAAAPEQKHLLAVLTGGDQPQIGDLDALASPSRFRMTDGPAVGTPHQKAAVITLDYH